MSSRFAMAAHIVGMLAWSQQTGRGPLTSDTLATSVNTHPVVVRRLLASLKQAGLVDSRRGARGGSVLACDPDRTTLREIYEAVADDETLLACAPGTATTCCDLGQHVHGWLSAVLADAEEALKSRLGEVSIAQMRDEIDTRASGCTESTASR